MGRVSKYPDELRERAVRMVAEVRPQYPSRWAAITAVTGMLGIGTPETLRTWILRDGRGEQGAAQGDCRAVPGQ
jgi:transposase